jgi:hypothetical protein
MAEKFTLYAPDGRKYVTGDKTEAVRLKAAHGYTEKAPKQASAKSEK